jgi:hypothetical protein
MSSNTLAYKKKIKKEGNYVNGLNSIVEQIMVENNMDR